MNEIVGEEHINVANKLRKLMSKYLDLELLVQVGEYSRGTDTFSDQAIDLNEPIQEFLTQHTRKAYSYNNTRRGLRGLLGG